jgi:hypothetical protein
MGKIIVARDILTLAIGVVLLTPMGAMVLALWSAYASGSLDLALGLFALFIPLVMAVALAGVVFIAVGVRRLRAA